jgi:uncharacterized protein involved in exopolysaccharide biosynthesis
MSDPIDDYANRLTQALRDRGIDDPRIIAEAREHLLDMVAEGRRRGLAPDEAERDAFERFGAPEIVAAHAFSEVGRGSRSGPGGGRSMSRLAAALDTMWQRKWWILAPTVVTALVTSMASTYLLPTRYRSEAVIQIVPQRVPADVASSTTAERPRQQRFRQVAQLVLSRTRLERVIMDFGLYETRRGSAPTSNLVTQMRRDIALDLIDADHARVAETDGFSVSFVAADPKTAVRVTERIASLFIEENLRDREGLAQNFTQFIESRIEETRNRIVEYEAKLAALRAQGNTSLSRADLLPYEVLQESYRALLTRAEEARTTEVLERRQIGEQFKIIDAARLPERPLGPSRLEVSAAGAFAGLGLGVLMVSIRGRSKRLSA